MIRINLLGIAKQKGKRGSGGGASPEVSMPAGPGGSPMVKILVILLIAGVFNAAYWWKLDKEKRDIAAKMAIAEAKNRELAEVKARYMERQRQARSEERRVGKEGRSR